MSESRFRPEGEGLLTLVRETVDGIGRLISEHLTLARLEFQNDIKSYGRSVAVLLLVAGIFVLAYALACVGLALFLSRFMHPANAFFLVAGVHLLIGVIAGAIAVRRLRDTQPMHETVSEVERSVSALASASGGGNGVAADGGALAHQKSSSAYTPGGETWPAIRR
jgi:uncharacterized membrane protein YqjE